MSEVRGLFITLEGGDGSGKSTQSNLLRDWCLKQGRKVLCTREPGGTDVGVAIRDIVLHHRGYVSDRAEALLYAADRAQHIDYVVRPHLEQGYVVIQDRYIDSSIAYQGTGRTLGREDIAELSGWATQHLMPNLTIVLDLDEKHARERLKKEQKVFDRLETQHLEFHARVRQAYLELAAHEPERFLVLDASQSVFTLHELIIERLQQYFDQEIKQDDSDSQQDVL